MVENEREHLEFRSKLAPRNSTNLMPKLSKKAELALLCRILHREGYDDHVAGHISYKQDDGTYLVNPFELTWDEILPENVIRINKSGEVIDGVLNVTPAINLHIAIHDALPDVNIIIHNHPLYGTTWANAHRVPPVYDQTSSKLSKDPILIPYEGAVNETEAAEIVASLLGDSNCALLSNHGVLVTASNIRQAHLRAITLEWRSRLAWYVEALGGGIPIPATSAKKMGSIVDKYGSPFLFEAMVRREIRFDPQLKELLSE